MTIICQSHVISWLHFRQREVEFISWLIFASSLKLRITYCDLFLTYVFGQSRTAYVLTYVRTLLHVVTSCARVVHVKLRICTGWLYTYYHQCEVTDV